ncbi:ABC transporter ATP-binding protein [Cohaesibacter gelatinilyticus]|uniref:Spermidine/putrescine import ATP-binding protein PotA n=1 Tax=Cohaesibacter gelatinilyticus TaxID=372072 RepID=A0A285NHF0_9HYPH|nr:ABC transporter ATP-binding protein [Cohaesibacter gelatinilyticus]SNZ08417.1 putative spermidine/putrescine transport system ATP-binding protein [Cohaesibacter gelatinilyticus]
MLMQDNKSFVRFENIQKTYDGETLVIKNLNLDIAKGEFVTLLGPSGSGKSTSLMLLAGFEQPTAGTVYLDGNPLNSVPPYERNIGIVFQNYALFPHMTVLENIAFPLTVRKMGKAEAMERAQKALDMVRLGAFGDRRPTQLSGGQQQRIAVARSLVFDPALVLMDEPLGALDRKLREEMQIEIKHIHENLGVTIVFVTHDQDEALTMSDKVAVFNDGIIQQYDTPATLYEKPSNTFVASFLGETNMLKGSINKQAEGKAEVKLACGSTILSTAVDPHDNGDPTTLCIRPERIQLKEDHGDEDNGLHTTVVETIYHGAFAKVVLALNSGEQLKALVRAGNINADLTPGHKILATFASEDARALA